jgi:hypothetical protein
MTDEISCIQVIYAWAGSSTSRGYQVIGASQGLQPADLQYLSYYSLPTSFSVGDFTTCERHFILPSGNHAFNFVSEGGSDLLGRKGVYYSHTIIVPQKELYSGKVDPMDIENKFVKDKSEIMPVIEAFHGDIINMPVIKIPSHMNKQVKLNRVVSYFKSDLTLSFLIDRLLRGGTNILLSVSETQIKNSTYEIFSELLKCLPNRYLLSTYSTFSNNLLTESKMFSMIQFPASKIGSTLANPSQYLVIDPFGTYFPYKNPYAGTNSVTPGQFLAKAILSENVEDIVQFSVLFNSYPDNIDSYSKSSYAVSEMIFAENRSLQYAFMLVTSAITKQRRDKYLQSLVDLINSATDLEYLKNFFLNTIKGTTDTGAIGSLINEAINVFYGIMSKESSSMSLNNTGKVSSQTIKDQITDMIKKIILDMNTRKIEYNYMDIFSLMSGEDLTPDSYLVSLLSENEYLYDLWINNFLMKNRDKAGIKVIQPLLESAKDKKEIKRIFTNVYKKIWKDTSLRRKYELIKSFIFLDRTDLDVAFDIYRDMLKDLRNEPSKEIFDSVIDLRNDFIDLGMKRDIVAKATEKYVDNPE